MLMEEVPPGGDNNTGFCTGVLLPARGICSGVSCWGCGGGELAVVDPTDPGSLKPWVLLSSGLSKKHRLNSWPASKDTSGFILSGDGALPRLPLNDWSILNTSILPLKRSQSLQNQEQWWESFGVCLGSPSSYCRFPGFCQNIDICIVIIISNIINHRGFKCNTTRYPK